MNRILILFDSLELLGLIMITIVLENEIVIFIR